MSYSRAKTPRLLVDGGDNLQQTTVNKNLTQKFVPSGSGADYGFTAYQGKGEVIKKLDMGVKVCYPDKECNRPLTTLVYPGGICLNRETSENLVRCRHCKRGVSSKATGKLGRQKEVMIRKSGDLPG
jgi:hypothetical protein